MLSMTHSTESKEKKEIWGNRVQTQGWDAQEWGLPRREPPFVTLIRAWVTGTGEPVPFLRA